jgi:two-component system response regulator VicR
VAARPAEAAWAGCPGGRWGESGVTPLAERILVVDDEKALADILRFNLEREGFEVVVAHTGPEAVQKAVAADPALVILDVMLPQRDGFSVCQEIRARSGVPILMLTAKDSEEDKVRGLELGADDYVTKPFSPRELVARVRAILRRAPSRGDVLRSGELEMDLRARTVRKRGEPLGLTVREFELLRYLLERPGQPVSREELLANVWGYEYLGDVRTVDVAVRRLREKVEDNPSDPRYIVTRRGAGYSLGQP